ncbi:transposase [Amycolatopsis sp. NPDC051903]|uniref:transposase n=1 Tax=Amycolatopsis sp. NPDC051903 TaxID=3363936 RepID=UPI0037AFED2B
MPTLTRSRGWAGTPRAVLPPPFPRRLGRSPAVRLPAAEETPSLWAEELDYPDLAEDIALEARLTLHLTEEINDRDERIRVLLCRADPAGIVASVPGVGSILAAQILGRLDQPGRFTSLDGIRSYAGLRQRNQLPAISRAEGWGSVHTACSSVTLVT